EERAEEQVVTVDVETVHVDAAHRHTAQVGEAHSGALEVRPEEGRAFQGRLLEGRTFELFAGICRHCPIITPPPDTAEGCQGARSYGLASVTGSVAASAGGLLRTPSRASASGPATPPAAMTPA